MTLKNKEFLLISRRNHIKTSESLEFDIRDPRFSSFYNYIILMGGV